MELDGFVVWTKHFTALNSRLESGIKRFWNSL
jgi:hypothetical protein